MCLLIFNTVPRLAFVRVFHYSTRDGWVNCTWLKYQVRICLWNYTAIPTTNVSVVVHYSTRHKSVCCTSLQYQARICLLYFTTVTGTNLPAVLYYSTKYGLLYFTKVADIRLCLLYFTIVERRWEYVFSISRVPDMNVSVIRHHHTRLGMCLLLFTGR